MMDVKFSVATCRELITIYVVYDMKDDEVVVCCGTATDVQKFLDINAVQLNQAIRRKSQVYHRYKIKKFEQ